MNCKLFSVRLDEATIAGDQEQLNRFLGTVEVKKTSTQYVPSEPDYWSVLVFYKEKKRSTAPTYGKPQDTRDPTPPTLTPEQLEIVTALKAWRRDKAHFQNMPEYIVCHNATLEALARQKPRTLAELAEVKGFGEQKVTRYGDDVIAILCAF